MASNTNRPKDGTEVGVNMNRDPITGTPGAHPVGAGAGAAVGAAVGGAIGAVGGPIGIVAGAAVGGLAGGWVGKEAGEAVNPTGEVEYWRTEFPKRPYASGRNFDQFAPAYHYTAEAYTTYPGRSFNEVEADLAREWPKRRKTSTLEWNDVKQASRDAWDRITTNSKSSKNTTGTPAESASTVNSLIATLYNGSKGFRQAAESVKDPAMRSGLLKFAQQRETFIGELKPLVAQAGKTPEDSGTTLGAMHRAWIDLKDAVTQGDYAILAECERGEDNAVESYQETLQAKDLAPQFRSVIQRQYQEVHQAHDQVKMWRDSLKR